MFVDQGWLGRITTCPFSITVRAPCAGSWRVDPEDRLKLGRNLA
jgi:hypothetical protein